MRLRLLLLSLLLAASAGAQQVSTAVVPVVGSVFGASMVRWKTDVEIENASPFPAEVMMELPTVGALYGVTLAPGERQRFPDAVAQLFGLDNALSALRVTSDRRVVVRASAYAASEGGLSPLQPIDVYYAPPFAPFRMLDNLAFSDDFRTNIGLVNFGERDAQFTLALRRIAGRDLAVTLVTVPAGSMSHMSIQSLFPMITEGTGFSILVETSARETYVYGSVIESENNAARFITPRIGTQ
ncbi:MAG TPA: hypothetical protein VJZ00_25775 [Thermoanaerobaculia bacterium]|nr:hypothetical protein [Thermoanaerobaculia bacterium]